MSNFANRTMGVSRKGTADGATAAGGFSAPRMSLGSGHLFSGCRIINLAVKPPSFRVETSVKRDRHPLILSSRSRAFVISARPNCRGFGPGFLFSVPN
jgi:hypothetical protein